MRSVAATIVIPTRNRFSLLVEAIESIRAQTLPNWEVIVVDDASDDTSVLATEQLLRGDDRLKLIVLDEHSERSTARNTGLAETSGRYVLFLDDDDRLAPRALEILVAALDANANASVAIGARRVFDARGHVVRAPHPPLRVRRELSSVLLLGWLSAWVAVPGQCLLRADALRAVGAWNETLVVGEDQELLLRLATGRPAVLVPQTVLEYRLHGHQWRPSDAQQQEDAFRLDASRRLANAGRDDAPRLLRAGKMLRDTDAAYARAEYWKALKLLRAAGVTAPSILTSPITAPRYLYLCAKSAAGVLLGKTLSGLFRKGRARCRRLLHHAPEASVAVLQSVRTLPGRELGYRSAPDPTLETEAVLERRT